MLSYVKYLSLLLLCPITAHALLGDIPTNLLEPIKVPLQWENVTETPLWVNGKAPEFNAHWGMHRVHLEPEQSVTVQLMPGKWLRIYHPDDSFASDTLEISVSSGNGLYAYLSVHIVEQGHSILVPPDPTLPRLVRIQRGKQHNTGQTFALFTSRYKPIIPPKILIPIESESVSFLLMPQRIFKDYWRIEACCKPLEVTLQGPARVFVETRLIYPASESVLAQDYQIYAQLDKECDPCATHVLEFETGAETEQQITIDDQAPVLGRLQVGYLEIPDGEHVLRLTSTATLYIRLLRDREFDYLFPELNSPEPDVKPNLPKWINRASWQLTEEELSLIASFRPNTMMEIEKIAFRIARDNSRQEGGLLGAMILREVFRRYPYYDKIRQLSNSLLGKHTFYRDLLPWKTERSSLRFHWFIPYELRPPELPNLPLIVAEQHQDDYLKRIPGAYFSSLSPRSCCIQQQIYKLPRRTVPSLLRIIIKEPTSLEKPHFLFVQFDNLTPVTMQVIPQHFERDRRNYRFNQGDAGLRMLALDHNTEAETLGGPFATRRQPASLINTSSFVLPLPSKVRQIKVWLPAGDTETLHIALQYRASRPFRYIFY